MRKGHYIILTHSYTPMKDDRTKMNCTEKCEFVDDIKKKHISGATAILDAEHKTFVKNRVRESSYAQYIEHIEKTHPREYGEFKKYLIEVGVTQPQFKDLPVKANTAGNIEVA